MPFTYIFNFILLAAYLEASVLFKGQVKINTNIKDTPVEDLILL